mmetsp:Transcript_6367/g.13912  ORF Transcript_6367/g.13912 Transcript_6367/m.13912 type:complete len:237 (-) Transcript_6367:963-1673(-)
MRCRQAHPIANIRTGVGGVTPDTRRSHLMLPCAGFDLSCWGRWSTKGRAVRSDWIASLSGRWRRRGHSWWWRRALNRIHRRLRLIKNHCCLCPERWHWWLHGCHVHARRTRPHHVWTRQVAPHGGVVHHHRLLHSLCWHIHNLLLALVALNAKLLWVLNQEVLQTLICLLQEAPGVLRERHSQHAQQEHPTWLPSHVRPQLVDQSLLVHLVLEVEPHVGRLHLGIDHARCTVILES